MRNQNPKLNDKKN